MTDPSKLSYAGKERAIDATYADPVDLIWVEAARRCGVEIVRSPDVFASWDGAGTLTISTQDEMDPDDFVGQMVFHELCHALVAGPTKHAKLDWGLREMQDGDYLEEHATNRLQVALATPHGLRALFGTTTVFRLYYDALPADPLVGDDDPALPLAREAFVRATEGPWAEHLEDALRRTAEVHRAVSAIAPADSLWSR